jgi:hypothetical protein
LLPRPLGGRVSGYIEVKNATDHGPTPETRKARATGW